MSLIVESVHASAVGTALAVSRSGRWWVSAGTNEAQVWSDGVPVAHVRPTGFVHGAPAFDADERHVTIGAWSVELRGGELTRRWTEPTWLTECLPEDVREWVTFDSFGTPFVADVRNTNLVVVRSEYQPPRGRGDHTSYGGPTGQLLLVDLVGGAEPRVLLDDADETVRSIDVGSTAIAAAVDDRLCIWSRRGDVIERPVEASHDESVVAVGLAGTVATGPTLLATALSAAGDEVVTLDERGAASITTLSGEPVASWQAHHGWARAVCWAADGAWLATGADDGVVRLWSIDGSSVEQIGEYTGDPVAALAAGHDGRLLLVGGDVVHRGVTVLAVDR